MLSILYKKVNSVQNNLEDFKRSKANKNNVYANVKQADVTHTTMSSDSMLDQMINTDTSLLPLSLETRVNYLQCAVSKGLKDEWSECSNPPPSSWKDYLRCYDVKGV